VSTPQPDTRGRSPAPADDHADVLIVGAGAAGGVVGRRLAGAGFHVVCLEQGRWQDPTEYPGQHADWELASQRRWSADPNVRAQWEDYPIDATDSDVVPLMYNAVGGSTILYAGDWPRMLPSDFRVRSLDGVADDWPLPYAELESHYDRTDREMGVSGLSGDPAYPPSADPPLPPLPIGAEGMAVARGHNRLGWHWWPGRSAITSAPYQGRRPCVGWGACMQGCPEGAKASTDLTHWPHAVEHGARLVTGARVHRVVLGSTGLATGVEYIDADGRERFQGADVVVLAANAVGTARLLLLSAQSGHPDGLANSSGLVGRRLMMHPFGVVTGTFPERYETWRGHVGVRITSLEFYETDERRGFVRGSKWSMAPSTGGPLNAAMPSRAGGVVWGPEHHLLVRERFGHMLSWGVFGEDLPDADNRVELDGVLTDASGITAPKVTYTVSDNSRRLLDFSCARAAESLTEAGATHVDVTPMLRQSGWHIMGTARMGTDPASSVVDEWGRTHDVENLYVVDGSVFVTSGGVNPTSTICALASRFAGRMIARRADQRVPR
jgi:choline dehydrogenase-like flavoprotein